MIDVAIGQPLPTSEARHERPDIFENTPPFSTASTCSLIALRATLTVFFSVRYTKTIWRSSNSRPSQQINKNRTRLHCRVSTLQPANRFSS
jgi:hypothetical protein